MALSMLKSGIARIMLNAFEAGYHVECLQNTEVEYEKQMRGERKKKTKHMDR